MEIKRHSRTVDTSNELSVDSFVKYLRFTIFNYQDMGDVLVSVESEDGNYTILEELDIGESYTGDALHRCLFVSPPPFKIICTIRVVTR